MSDIMCRVEDPGPCSFCGADWWPTDDYDGKITCGGMPTCPVHGVGFTQAAWRAIAAWFSEPCTPGKMLCQKCQQFVDKS